MAKKPQEHGCSLAVILLALPVLAFLHSLPYLLLAAFFLFPIFFIYLFARSSNRSPPARSDLTDDNIESDIQELHAERNALIEEITELRKRGALEGVRFLHPLGRFEMRSRRGQELNQSIEFVSALLADVLDKIEFASTRENRRLIAWQKAVVRWRHGRTFRYAFYAALIGWCGCVALVEMYYFRSWTKPPGLLIWNPFPSIIRYSLEVGTIVGWLSGLLTLYLARRFNRKALEHDPDLQLTNGDETAESNGVKDPDNANEKDPYNILNVLPNASVQEIKNAYRSAMKRCHPDTVADRSDRIKATALEEARLINEAYESIRSARKFS